MPLGSLVQPDLQIKPLRPQAVHAAAADGPGLVHSPLHGTVSPGVEQQYGSPLLNLPTNSFGQHSPSSMHVDPAGQQVSPQSRSSGQHGPLVVTRPVASFSLWATLVQTD